jgi:7-cyano-7-deazaguanine synthase
MTEKAVVLLSGGLDSSTVAAIAAGLDYSLYCLSFDYNQRHKVEMEAAIAVAKFMQAKEHVFMNVGLDKFGGSALTDDGISVPKHESVDDLGDGIPVTYVPARNLVFLSLAVSWAEAIGAQDIFLGVNALDYSGYPDCRPEFIRAFETAAYLSSKRCMSNESDLAIHTPIIRDTKAEIIRKGLSYGLDYGLTHSCYDPVGSLHCGKCDSCLLRKKGFIEAGVEDPTEYAG